MNRQISEEEENQDTDYSIPYILPMKFGTYK